MRSICFIKSVAIIAFALLITFAIAPSTAKCQDQPTIAKDWVQFTAFTEGSFKGSYDTYSWMPALMFRVNGPIQSGSQLYAEVNQPATPGWVKFDCHTEEIAKGRWLKVECGGRDVLLTKSTTYTGPVTFSIKVRNELAGTDATLFSGKATVAKAHSNLTGPTAVNKFVYYVDQDWNLPIGYVFLTADDSAGWKRPTFNVAFWARGEAVRMEPHLFYQGKEVGKMMCDGEEVGKPSCEAEVEDGTTQYVDDSLPQKARWSRVTCGFPNVRGRDTTGEGPGMFGPLYVMDKNPGEYEFKLLWSGHLARSIKFTVGSDGKFENGIAVSNKLGSDRVIVPVTIIGDQDGTWNRTAWKTDAFYGNPLTGFTAP
jgi:hypothetical protein